MKTTENIKQQRNECMPRVLVTPQMLRRQPGPHAEILAAAGLEVVYPPAELDTVRPGALEPLLEGIDAMLASTEPLTREILERTTLRAIARMGVGYDAIDVAAATERQIVVTITPGVLEESVAEHTIALLLGLTRDVVGRDHEVREGRWRRLPLPRMAGKTFGIVGLGRIGKAVVPRVQGLGMRVIAFDPFADHSFAETHEVRMTTLDELLETADVVSLHTPCTPDTAHLINPHSLASMKPTAVLINTSRGPLIDEEALANALAAGHLFGAALDVFKVEPLPLDNPLLSAPRVLLCSHMAGLDEESTLGMGRLAAQCLADLYGGKWPHECVVNRQLADDWRW
jgi:D-3-phosphoglycerate dehydrogenase / 2-oxoglutarate reductase